MSNRSLIATACRFCGCTETNACVTDGEPCHWHKPGYCSACALVHLEELAVAVCDFAGAIDRIGVKRISEPSGWPFELAWCDRLPDDGYEICLKDHIGVAVFRITDCDGASLAPHYDAQELLPLFKAEARAA